MLISCIINPAAPSAGGGQFGSGALGPLDPMETGDRGPLGHIVIVLGSPQRLRAPIRWLDALRYLDCHR